LQLQSAPDVHGQEMLQKRSGAEFDRVYMEHMVTDHKKTVAMFKAEAGSGKDAQFKAFAAKTLPTLEDHLKMAETVNAEAKRARKP